MFMNQLRIIGFTAAIALLLSACDAPKTEPAKETSTDPDPGANPGGAVVIATNNAPVVGETTVLGPFTGAGAPLHPDNISPHPIAYYGTDLGFTYEHQGELKILFGDTMADEAGAAIEGSNGGKFEDSFGTIELAQWQDPTKITPDMARD